MIILCIKRILLHLVKQSDKATKSHKGGDEKMLADELRKKTNDMNEKKYREDELVKEAERKMFYKKFEQWCENNLTWNKRKLEYELKTAAGKGDCEYKLFFKISGKKKNNHSLTMYDFADTNETKGGFWGFKYSSGKNKYVGVIKEEIEKHINKCLEGSGLKCDTIDFYWDSSERVIYGANGAIVEVIIRW